MYDGLCRVVGVLLAAISKFCVCGARLCARHFFQFFHTLVFVFCLCFVLFVLVVCFVCFVCLSMFLFSVCALPSAIFFPCFFLAQSD